MAEQDSASGVDLYHVAHVVSSYVRHHRVAADQLAGLIVEVHRTLAGLGRVPPRAGATPTSGADPTLGPAGLHRLPRVRVSRADASPASAGRARPRCRRLPHPLEPTSGLSSHRTGVFDTALDDGQGGAFWAPSRHGGTEPGDNRTAGGPAARPPTEAPAADINSLRFCSLCR